MKNQDSQPKKIRVRIDPVLQDLIPGYLANRGQDLRVCKKALEKNDYEAIARLGHTMKGSGGGYGLNDLSSIGRAIEKAAQNRDKDSVRKSIIDLTEFLNKLEVVYD